MDMDESIPGLLEDFSLNKKIQKAASSSSAADETSETDRHWDDFLRPFSSSSSSSFSFSIRTNPTRLISDLLANVVAASMPRLPLAPICYSSRDFIAARGPRMESVDVAKWL